VNNPGAALALASVLACTPTRPTASLRLHGGLTQATVTIDDEYIGPFDVVAAHGVAMPIGKHRILIEAPGYVPWQRTVEAKDQPVLLDVELVPARD
jgi:hypothetical protein